MKPRIPARAFAPNFGLGAVLLACSAWLWSAHAHADASSGTWSGEVEGRGDYFLERSTRVMFPGVRAFLEAPNGVRLQMQYAVDVISSASIAQTGGAKDGVFTELRHQIGAGVGKHLALGDNEIDVTAHGTFSKETDYTSWLYGANATFAWDERNHAVTLGVKRVDDAIYKNGDSSFRRDLGGLTTNLIFTQVLSSRAVLNLGYQLVYLHGYLGNAYRNALIGPLPHMEAPPEDRVRHNLEAQLAWYFPSTFTTLQLYTRVHVDSWSLLAVTPELRLYQQLGSLLNLRLRYRYYDQSNAEFALKSGATRYTVGYTGPITNDPKLSRFHSHQVGLRFLLGLSFLGDTMLRFASRASLDLSLDYQYCTNSFGNNWIGTLGGVLPF